MRARIAALITVVILCIFATDAPAEPGRPVRFSLERNTVSVGEHPKAIFDRPLPEITGERYWITITGAGEADPAWGLWQYVSDGTRDVQLKTPKAAGTFEVRLHDGYPRVQYNVVHRATLTVAPDAVAALSARTVSRRSGVANSSGTLRGKRVSWKGVEGDADTSFDPPGWNHPDIVGVEVEGKGGHLVVTLVFARDLRKVLEQKTRNGAMKGYMLAEVYFDIDGDATTGPALGMGVKRKGFDVDLEISTGLEMEGGGATITSYGNIESIPKVHKVTDVVTTYHVDDRTGNALPDDATTWRSDKAMQIKGRKLVVRVPYERLGLRRGKTVRVCFLDHTMDMTRDGNVSVDAELTLR